MTGWRRLSLAGALAGFVLVAGSRALDALATPTAATVDPRATLQAEPLHGQAFVALVSADATAVPSHHEIVARRAPRSFGQRAWLADHYLRSGDHATALAHLDVLLRLSPQARRELLPMLVQWSDNQAFAGALVDHLRGDPEWRQSLLSTLAANVATPGANAVYAGLREQGDVSEMEVARWIEALIRRGHWGRAYSHWVATLDRSPGEPLPMLHDGGFEQPVPDHAFGFGWRIGRKSGTYTELGPAAGATGQAAHIVFPGRQVDAANLEQAMVLPPGDYRLEMRLRAQSLRSSQGLRWTLTCAGKRNLLARGEPLQGTFDWRPASLVFTVPPTDCPGQWLRLDNPAPSGSAGVVEGDLWADDFAIRPVVH